MSEVSACMCRSVLTVSPDTTVREATRLADSLGAAHLLVIDGDDVVGVLCPVCDLGSAPPGQRVSACMHAPVVTIGAHASVEEAAALMRERGIGFLPVMLGKLVLGTVSPADLADASIEDWAPQLRQCAGCGGTTHLSVPASGDDVLFCAYCRDRVADAVAEEEIGIGD